MASSFPKRDLSQIYIRARIKDKTNSDLEMVETRKAQLGYGVTNYRWVREQFGGEDTQRKGITRLQSNSCLFSDKERIKIVHQHRASTR